MRRSGSAASTAFAMVDKARAGMPKSNDVRHVQGNASECSAQRAAVTTWLNGGKHELLGEFIEVESGKNNARPALIEALKLCRKPKATLVARPRW